MILVVLFLLVYLALAVIAFRRPLLARLAFREAVRRPWQSALIVVGLMVGATSIITLQVATDSEQASQVQTAYAAWGRVDVTVDANGATFSPDVAQRLAADPELAGSLAGVQNGMKTVAAVGDLDQRLGKPTVLVVGFDPATQAGFGAYVLSDGSRTFGENLAPGEVLLSQQLADALQAKKGDRLRVSAGLGDQASVAEMTVAGIARPEGPGATGLRPAIFAPLATVQRWLNTNQVNVIRVSAKGDGQAELDQAQALAPLIRARVGDTLVVRTGKADEAATYKTDASSNRGFTWVLSLFILLAATALVVNLTLGLAEERRPRLAVIRALGLTRVGLVQLAVFEGGLYSLAAAIVGILPGAFFAWLLTGFFFSARLGASGLLAPENWLLRIEVNPQTVLASIAVASLISLTTIALSSLRISRLTIATAIKNLPDSPRTRRRIWPRRLAIALLALGGIPLLVAGPNPLARYAGGVALIVAAVVLTSRILARRMLATVLGLAISAWSLVIVLSLSPQDANSNLSAFIVFTTMVGLIFSLCILFSANMRFLEVLADASGRWGGRLQATIRPPLAYLSRRPVRSGLGMGAFAVVLGLLGFYAVLASTSSPDYVRDGAGYDVAAFSSGTPTIAVPSELQSQVSRSTLVTARTYYGPMRFDQVSGTGGWLPSYAPLYQLTDEQLTQPPVRLFTRESRFKTDQEVFAAMRDDPTLILANNSYMPIRISLIGHDGPVTFHVVGEWNPGAMWGMIGSARAFSAFSHLPAGSTLLIKTAGGVDPNAFATSLRRSLFDQGVDADTVRHLIDLASVPNQAFIQYVLWVTRAGLVVGVAGLGLLVLRALIERRRVIGLLRALVYYPGQVLTGMLGEALLTVTAGVAIGVLAGVLMAYLYVGVAFSTISPSVDWAGLGFPITSIYIAVVLTAFVPALRASRLRPSEALRLVD